MSAVRKVIVGFVSWAAVAAGLTVAVPSPSAADTVAPFPVTGLDTTFGVKGRALINRDGAPTTKRIVPDGTYGHLIGSVGGRMAATSIPAKVPGATPHPIQLGPIATPGYALGRLADGSLVGITTVGGRRRPVVATFEQHTDVEASSHRIVDVDVVGDQLVAYSGAVAGVTLVAGEPTAFALIVPSAGPIEASTIDLGPGPDSVVSVKGGYLLGTAGGQAVIARLRGAGELDPLFGVGGLMAVPGNPTNLGLWMGSESPVVGGTSAAGTAVAFFPERTNIGTAGLIDVGLRGTVAAGGRGDGLTYLYVADVANRFIVGYSISSSSPLSTGERVVVPEPFSAVIGPLEYDRGVLVKTPSGTRRVKMPSAGGDLADVVGNAVWMTMPGTVTTLAERPDRRVIAAGRTHAGSWVAQLTATGVLDSTFGSGGVQTVAQNGDVVDLEAMADGKVMVLFTTHDITTVVRLTAAGRIDTTFGEAGHVALAGAGRALLRPDATGAVLVVGQSRVYRVGALGAVDAQFGTTPNGYAFSEAVDGWLRADGRIAVALAPSFGGFTTIVLDRSGRVDPAATLDVQSDYGSGYLALARRPDGNAMLMFSSPPTTANGPRRTTIVVTDGVRSLARRTLILAGGKTPATRLAVSSTGAVFVGVNESIVRLRTDLSVDRGFGIDGTLSGVGSGVLTSGAGGSVLAGGAVSGSSHGAVWRLTPTATVGTARSTFVALPVPVRLHDSRSGARPPLVASSTREIVVAGVGGIPANATAVAATVTAVAPAATGVVQLAGTGLQYPGRTRTLTTRARVNTSATAIVRVGARRSLTLFTSVATHATVDVTGYWVPATSARAGRLTMNAKPSPVVFDSRRAAYGQRAVARNTARIMRTGVSGATAAIVNVSLIGAPAAGQATLYAGSAKYVNPSVSYGAGTTASLMVVKLNTDGSFRFNSTITTHVVVELIATFTGASAPVSASGLFVAEPSARVIDSRQPALVGNSALSGSYILGGDGGLPRIAMAAFSTVTAFGAPRAGDVMVSGGDVKPRVVAIRALVPGGTLTNGALTSMSYGNFETSNPTGGHVIVETSGWFVA